jgi:Cu(I)/Ag(I) efflux system membrane fusion protein
MRNCERTSFRQVDGVTKKTTKDKTMTKMNSMMMVLLFSAALAALTGCKTAESAHATASSPTMKYTCPMHPEIVRDAPGNCPICGMTLVEKH